MLPSTLCSYFSSRSFRSAMKLIGIRHQQNHVNCGAKSFNIINCRLMAGHSKWQNVKHTKAAKDLEKSKLCGKYAYLVRLAVRENGPDPKMNAKLASFLEEARKHNVPYSTLENALKQAKSGKIKSGIIEILGPAGCYVVLDYEADNISTMRHAIKGICKRHKASIVAGEGRWRSFYQQKGIIKVTRTSDQQALDAEKSFEVAVEAGAEDIQLKASEDDETPFLEFYCDPANLFSVKKEVENQSHIVDEAYVGFIPLVTVQLSDEIMEVTSNFLAELAELPEVIRIYENVQ